MANPTTLYNLPDGRRAVDVTENKTLVAADAGIVQVVKTDAITVTLPTSAAATVGASFTVRNGGAKVSSSGPDGARSNESILVTLAPVAADGISGAQVTAAVNKAMLNTKATSKIGDEISVQGSGLTTAAAWFVTDMRGIWARAA